MTFKRPKNITITQMAQWVDANAMLPSCDENKLCEYLYHLVVLKTNQCSFFNDQDAVDDFAMYCVGRLFSRLRRESSSGSVKSIVNYIRNIISPWYADYVREFYTGSKEAEIANFDVFDFSDYLIDVSSQKDFNAYNFCCITVSDVLLKHMKTLPRKRRDSEWSNIYVSCLLTLNNRIDEASRIASNQKIKDPLKINSLIRSLKLREPILYRLDDSYKNYILTIVNEMTHALSVEVTHSIAAKVSPSACLRNMITASNNAEED